MGSVLQFAAFLAICWLFRGAVTHANQHEDKVLNSKHSNRNGPGAEDFYFDEEKGNDDNVKTGRAISQSAWSKEDKEQTQKIGNKTGGQFNYEFSFKNALSYFLDMIQELKKDILGLKEMTSLKNTKDSTNSRDNSKDNVKPNKKGKNSDAPKPDTSTKNNEFSNENQKPKSNYITDYYQKNGITFVDDELEISSDESDDSSHKLNEGDSMHEVNKNEDDRCIFECSERERKHARYSSGAEETTVNPISHTKIPEESDKEFDGTRDGEKGDNLKETTRKPSKMKQSNLKTSREETENIPISKIGTCMKKNDDNSHNLNEKNEQTTKPLISAEYITTRSPQKENFNEAKSERPNQNKSKGNFPKMTSTSLDSRNSGKKSKNEGGSDFDSKSGIPGYSTTLSSQSSKDVIYPENIGNEQDASGISSKKPIYKKQKEQTTYLKPGDHEQAQNNAKSLKNNDRSNEYSIVSLKPHVVGSEIPNNEMSTDTEIKSSPKESKDKRLDVSSSHTTVPYSENEPNSKKAGQQSSNSFGTGTTISPANSGNMNTDNLNKDPSDNLNGKKGANENKKPAANHQGKDYSEIQRNNESKQPQQLNDSEPEKTSKNNEFNYSNHENNNEKNDNLATMTTNDLPSPENSNREIQNYDVVESENLQEEQKNNENLKKRDGMLETSPDQEYDFEEDNEDFDISDELTDTEMDEDANQNEEGELITDNGNEMNDDEIDSDNIATVSRNESQISRHTGYVVEEKPQEQYNTFLEYFYKNSNNSLFQALKNQSNNFSRYEIN